MDPDVALQEIRNLVGTADTEGLDHLQAAQLADFVEGLDKWLSQGGFLPQAWANKLRE